MTNTGPESCSGKARKSTTPTRRTTRSSARNEQIPPLCCHKATGYAYVNLNGTCRYLGAKYGTQQADANYNKLITEWLAKLKNNGMPYIAIGRCIRYSLPDVQHWIMQQQNKDENDSDELPEEVYNGNTC